MRQAARAVRPGRNEETEDGEPGSNVSVMWSKRGSSRFLWWASTAFSVGLLAALISIWYLVGTTMRDIPGIGSPVLDQADVGTFLTDHPGPDVGGERLRIPTGVFVQSLEFLSTNNIQVTGYVWQTYAASVPSDIQRGFVLPEAVDEAYQTQEVYRHAEAEGETIGWYFHATLRQAFDYQRYPFDRQDVWLRLRHPDFGRGVLLVPDFASYTDMTPTALPGLETKFVYEGWEPEFAGFSYVLNRYTTMFGAGMSAGSEPVPELYYSVGLKRDFLSPLLDHALPLEPVMYFGKVRIAKPPEYQ